MDGESDERDDLDEGFACNPAYDDLRRQPRENHDKKDDGQLEARHERLVVPAYSSKESSGHVRKRPRMALACLQREPSYHLSLISYHRRKEESAIAPVLSPVCLPCFHPYSKATTSTRND